LTVCLGFALVLGLGSGITVGAQQGPNAALTALGMKTGPLIGDLGGIAKVDVPDGYGFLGKGGASKFMEMLQNPSDGSEIGVVLAPTGDWFVVFTFSDDGYVKDDDRSIDAKAILSSIKEGTEQANKERRKRGWSTLEVVGWQQSPFYDPKTNNLTWAIKGRSDNGTSINHSTRLLGRRGVMNVDLVLDPDALSSAMPTFTTLLEGFSFNPGNRYSEFTTGDKVAGYGLAGLVLGGAGVALVKTGLLQKFWKVIVVGFLALMGFLKRFFFGGKPSAPTAPPTSHRPPPPGYTPPPARRPANG
jgi:uncharacterized membrane-anchored protein